MCKNQLMKNENLIAQFVEGLRFDIKEKVKLQPFFSLSDVLTYAELVEEINELNSKKSIRRGSWNTNSSSKPTST